MESNNPKCINFWPCHFLLTCKNGEMQNQAAVSIGMDRESIHLYYTVCFTILKDFEALEEPDSFIP